MHRDRKEGAARPPPAPAPVDGRRKSRRRRPRPLRRFFGAALWFEIDPSGLAPPTRSRGLGATSQNPRFHRIRLSRRKLRIPRTFFSPCRGPCCALVASPSFQPVVSRPRLIQGSSFRPLFIDFLGEFPCPKIGRDHYGLWLRAKVPSTGGENLENSLHVRLTASGLGDCVFPRESKTLHRNAVAVSCHHAACTRNRCFFRRSRTSSFASSHLPRSAPLSRESLDSR